MVEKRLLTNFTCADMLYIFASCENVLPDISSNLLLFSPLHVNGYVMLLVPITVLLQQSPFPLRFPDSSVNTATPDFFPECIDLRCRALFLAACVSSCFVIKLTDG